MTVRHMIAITTALTLLGVSTGFAQQRSTPTVIGPTGRPYGPTQAEYQYQLRYGHPSPGNTSGSLGPVNGYPAVGSGGGGFAVNPFLYLGFNPYANWYPPQGYGFYPSTAYYNNFYNYGYGPGVISPPVISTPSQAIIGSPPLPPLPAFNNAMGANALNLNGNPFPTITKSDPIIEPSTPKAQEESFRHQTSGDRQLEQLSFLAASQQYRKAIDAARDRVEPRYRLALTLAARSRFSEAVDQLKLASTIDPTWPQHAESLDDLIGHQNTFEKTRIKQRVAEWTLQDSRDPNRLFLLGAFLYLDGDPNSKQLIETAMLLAGKEQHLLSFAAPRAVPIVPEKAPQGQQVVVPPEVEPHPAVNGDEMPQAKPRKPIPAIPPLPEEVEPAPADAPPSDAANADGQAAATGAANAGEGPFLPPLSQ